MRFRIRNKHFFALDLLLFPAVTFLAYAIRFEGLGWSAEFQQVLRGFILASIPLKLIVLFNAGMYRRLWRYASVTDLETIVAASAVSGLICGFVGAFILPLVGVIPTRVPLSVL